MHVIRISAAFVLLRAAVMATLFISLWTWFVPRWMAGGVLRPHWSAGAIALMAIGGAGMLKCVWDFARRGEGTPAPFDPPRKLVIAGLYRYVRNPMYVSMGICLTGEALLLPAITRPMLILIATMCLVITALVMAYEEPALRRQFGDDYAAYCRNVRRWIPRLTPFDNTRGRR
ncbi:MAG TPA: isoprenylcysteine carboxylmethyltransferase family protein [Thermoanaerobaculia bacterium]|nr:isoprenylcysteine carboxylmethyltransferase family protein [Thermoanaerobaculia bacterium]